MWKMTICNYKSIQKNRQTVKLLRIFSALIVCVERINFCNPGYWFINNSRIKNYIEKIHNTFSLCPAFQSNHCSFMMRNMEKAFYNEIPPRCWFCVFVETSNFFLVVVLKPMRRRNLSKCVPHMQPGYLSCLNLFKDLQLSTFLKLRTVLVNLST